MKIVYYVLLLFTSLLWAGNFVAGKFAVGHADSITLTNLRWISATLLLLPIVWFKEKRLLPPVRALLPLFLMGLTGVMLFNVFMFLALERTTADNVGLLSALNPVAIAIASFLILRERMTRRQLLAVIVSLFGVLVVISHGDLGKLLRFHFNAGDLWMLAAVGIWGLYSVAGKKAMQHVSPYMATLWAGIFGSLILIPFNLPTFGIENGTASFWIAVIYMSLGGTVLAMLFWNIGVQAIGGTNSGIFLNFNPVFTAILAFVLLGENMGASQIAGAAIVIAGVYLFTSKPRAAAWKNRRAEHE